MRVRLSTFFGMVIVICGASIVGRVVKVISVDDSYTTRENNSQKDTLESINLDELNQLGNSSDHLIWFIQISDLHLSIFRDKSRIPSFQDFANVTIDVVKPSVVLASGDLTDAKAADMLGSKQYIEEWIAYHDVITKSGVQEKTVWLDIRGNHDNFDVPDLTSSNNYYQRFSVQGPKHQRSYMYTLKKGYDTVSFIAVDACLLPGPRRPFNFIGVLTAKEMTALEAMEENSRNHNYTIWFGHYPTSCIISPEPGIRRLMGGGLAYLCGHLHSLGGLAHNLYTRQHTGSLELELADWKDERLFRVAAIDHGLFSFVDVPLGKWPIILITNPKNALFSMSQIEPLHLIFHSTCVRTLVWSAAPLTQVQVRFEEDGDWQVMTHIEGPLYVAPWDPVQYSDGLHTIEVFARDEEGRENVVSQPFALDSSQLDFSLWSRAVLMSNVSVVFFFGLSICLCIVPLCIVRWIHHLIQEKKMVRPRLHLWFLKIWLRKIWVVCCTDKLFWPLVLYSTYMPLGPWFVGEVLEGHVGVVFAWGTFVYNSYLPGSLTYAYGFVQTVIFQFPLIFVTAHSADLRFQALILGNPTSKYKSLWCHSIFVGLIVMQAFNSYYFWLAYGTMALILGPLRTWATLLGIYLWYQSSALQEKDFRPASSIWALTTNSASEVVMTTSYTSKRKLESIEAIISKPSEFPTSL